MDCILGGCSSADTTVITNVPWGMVVGAGGVLAVPKGGVSAPQQNLPNSTSRLFAFLALVSPADIKDHEPLFWAMCVGRRC